MPLYDFLAALLARSFDGMYVVSDLCWSAVVKRAQEIDVSANFQQSVFRFVFSRLLASLKQDVPRLKGALLRVQ